eukprot:3527950-Amphidinium_carterae.1
MLALRAQNLQVPAITRSAMPFQDAIKLAPKRMHHYITSTCSQMLEEAALNRQSAYSAAVSGTLGSSINMAAGSSTK